METVPTYNFQSQRLRKRKRRKLIKLFIYTFIGVIGMYFLFNHFMKNETSTLIEGSTTSITTQPSVSPIATTDSQAISKPLEETINRALEGTKGTYGVIVKNLKTGEMYSANEHRSFEAASLYKLWTMAVVINKLQNGELKEDQILSQSASELNDKFDIDSEVAEQTSGTITFSVGNGLKQMITISHNYAALLLTEKVKLASLTTFLEQNGFSESKVGTKGEAPVTTPYDMALFFEKLYKGEFANEEYTNKMIDLLKQQQLNGKLPKYLPPDVVIAHKTGNIESFTHDAGIVYSPKGDYIIVVLTESNSLPGAEDRIGQVSKAVYEYFENK